MTLHVASPFSRQGRWNRPWQTHALAIAVLTGFSWLLFFHWLDRRALWSSQEGRAGQHAQLMLNTGRWGMPTLYAGWTDHQKPPLYYWTVAAVAWLRGGAVDAWAIRLPAAAAALAGVWLVYAFGCVLWRPASGFVAAIMLATNMRYSWLARVGRIDMPMTLAVSAVMLCFWMAYRRMASERSQARVTGWLLAAYLAAACAVMLKGPVGLVLPLIAIWVFLAIERQPVWPWQRGVRDLANGLGVWWGVPLILAIAGPWFVWATVVTDGEFFRTFFLHHNLDRTLGAEGLKPGPVWYYVPQILVDLFPWSVLIPAAIIAAMRRNDRSADPATRFVLSWTLAMFVFLSLVRFKRHDYLLPLLPGLALLLAGYWTRLLASATHRAAWRWAWAMSAIMLVSAIVVVALVVLVRDERTCAWLLGSELVQRSMHDTDRLVFGQLREAFVSWPAAASFVCGLVAAAGILGLVAVRRRRPILAVAMFGTAWTAAFLLYVDRVLPTLEPLREQRSLAELARAARPAGAALFFYGREDQQAMFYLGPEARWLPNQQALCSVMQQSDPVFVLMELGRFRAEQQDAAKLVMDLVASNTDNPFGAHRDPTVLVTNDAGRRAVQSRRAADASGRAN